MKRKMNEYDELKREIEKIIKINNDFSQKNINKIYKKNKVYQAMSLEEAQSRPQRL